MRGFDLLSAMELTDLAYVEQANIESQISQSEPIPGKGVRFRTLAACLLLLLATGVTAFATDMYGQLVHYVKTENQTYMEQMIASSACVSNEDYEFRIDAAIADSHACHFLVSFTGKTEKKKAALQSNLYDKQFGVFELLEATAIKKDGTVVDFWNRSAGATGKRTGWKTYSFSLFEDTDITYFLTCEFNNWNSMKDLKGIELTFDGMSLFLDVKDYMVKEYPLYTKMEDAPFKNLTISELGLYFEAPVSMFFDKNKQTYQNHDRIRFSLIDRYGKVLELEEDDQILSYGTSYNNEDELAYVSGSWKFTGEMEIGIIDLDDYCGVQIDGYSYYFRESEQGS